MFEFNVFFQVVCESKGLFAQSAGEVPVLVNPGLVVAQRRLATERLPASVADWPLADWPLPVALLLLGKGVS